MGEVAMDRTQTSRVEAILREELAREDRALLGVAPVISHLLASSGHSLVSDAIVARLRGMLSDIARQLLETASRGSTGRRAPDAPAELQAVDRLADELAMESAILNHLYALAMEGHLTQRLEQRSSLDPVLSPLLQELIASDQPAIAELAMNTLAAQSRFVQGQRRMELPLGELPAELFLAAIGRFEATLDESAGNGPALSLATLKQDYNEAASRLGLLARLVSAMKGGAVAALELDHAGFALFATALGGLTRQSRDLAVLACHERQSARLALSLRAAGQEADAIERQFLLVEQAEMLPLGISQMPPERALALLASSTSQTSV